MYTLDRTWQEIHDAMLLGPCGAVYTTEDSVIARLIGAARKVDNGEKIIYRIIEVNPQDGSSCIFDTDTPTGFPDYDEAVGREGNL